MKPFFLILALAIGVRAQHSGSDLGINVNYDKFQDVSTVELKESLMPDRPGYVILSVTATIKGKDIEHTPPDSVVVFITSFTDEWYFLKTENTFRVIQDGRRYELGKMKISHSEATVYGVFELLSLPVTFAAVEKLSQGSKIEIQVGRYETELKPEAIKNIAKWVKWFPRKPK